MNYLTKHKLHLNNAPLTHTKREEICALIIKFKAAFLKDIQHTATHDKLSGTGLSGRWKHAFKRHAGDNK
jgi:hypothetical protein